MDYEQEERDLGTILEVYIRVFSTRLLRVSDIGSWLLLFSTAINIKIIPCYRNDVGLWDFFLFWYFQ